MPGISSLRFVVTLAVGALGFAAPAARAAVLPFLTGAGPDTANNAGFTLGYEINVGASPIRVSSLGVWDEGSDGLAASHAVGLWNSTGTTLLASVTVPAGTATTLVDGYRFADLASTVDLAANTTYVVGAVYNSDDLARDITGANFNNRNSFASSGVTIGHGGFEFGGTSLNFPSGGLSTIYNGPNALFTVVPEPGVALSLLPLLSLPLFRRSRRGAR